MGRVFASSDWHGCGIIAKKVLKYLQSDDILYFIGDIADRGKDGAELLNILMKRPNTYYIKGNHDYMMEITLPYIIKDKNEIDCIEAEKYPDQTWFSNGGWATLEGGLFEKSIEELSEYYNFLKNLPTELKYISPMGHMIILEHAGYTPFDIPHRSHDSLWDREHFYDKWNLNYCTDQYIPYTPNNIYIVHGHTPVQYLKYYFGYIDRPPFTKEDFQNKTNLLYGKDETLPKPEIIRYCDNHKFDIDMGAFFSNRIALLDLDTFEYIYFDKE